ncbi:Amino acid permease [Bifidobacterium magnum]|uniref:Amino acid permease n=1 Tax=Bifidobacterium magnum TaxID=1692 RepID=A0A087BAP8_9BIFI|nr:Amino acid permease [Bifidobacterium magnum]
MTISHTSPNGAANSNEPARKAGPDQSSHNSMNRGLTSRHVQFIAIGGTIGTGLFLGSGQSIALTGPSIVLVYIFVGLMMFIMMRAIGELMYRDPDQHTFINFVGRYLGKGWGNFAIWTYWIALLFVGMTELTAVGDYFVTFFDTFGIDMSAWKSLIEVGFLVLLVLVNLSAVKVFGEAEFWFAMIKITLICAMIATAVVMLVIGYHYSAVHVTGQDAISPAGAVSIKNLFVNFSLMPNGWMKFLMSFQMVFFAYTLIEFVGVTVSETKNPRKVMPKAINSIIMRVLIFYVGALLAIMCIVPWTQFKQNADGTFASPFIMVFEYAGLNWAAGLVFFVVLTASASSLNSLLYSAGRHLFQKASESENPRFHKLGEVSGNKVPGRAIIASACLILVVPIVNFIPQLKSSFVLFSSCANAFLIIIYIMTMLAHRKYRKSPDFMPDGFLLPAWKVTNTLAIVFYVFIFATLFISADTRLPGFISAAWLIVFGTICVLKEKRSLTESEQAQQRLQAAEFTKQMKRDDVPGPLPAHADLLANGTVEPDELGSIALGDSPEPAAEFAKSVAEERE